MIEVRNLTKRYGPNIAVDNLSFTVDKNQVYGFLGPNGAGKSTTMNIMTGYLSTTEGDVIINGHSILEEPEEAKANIGFLPELPPLYTEMTPYEYLCFVAEIKKIPKAQRKAAVQEAIDMTDIDHVKNRLIKNLSKGYRQRVGFAEALLGKPPVIILDEPMVGLDPLQIIEMRNLIKDLGREHTVILSSHILSEIAEVCDKILIIAHGKLVALGTPAELEEQMGGGRIVLSLSVKGEKEAAENVLKSFGADYSFEAESDGVLSVKVEFPEDADRRDDLYYAFADARLPIISMTSQIASLEEVFLELTAAEDPARPADDQKKEEK